MSGMNRLMHLLTEINERNELPFLFLLATEASPGPCFPSRCLACYDEEARESCENPCEGRLITNP